MRTADLASRVLSIARKKGLKIATAESCTGGMIAAALTDIAGSSDVFDRGFVTYSNDAKIEMLGVSPDTLDMHGAVSSQTAKEMATGAITSSNADISVSVTGIAGPGGGSEQKPVGLVWFGIADATGCHTEEMRFGELSRAEIRHGTMARALTMLLERLERL